MLVKGKVVWGVLVLVCLFGLVTLSWAQNGETEDTTATADADNGDAQPADVTDDTGVPTKWTAWETIKAGGLIGLVIILLSIVALALIIEHFMSINDDKLIPPDFVAALQANIEEKKYQDAITLCEASDNYISRIMQVGLSEIPYGYDSMVEAMATVGEEESIKLNQKIGYLSFIGMITPMLGLLGTVVGMIISFNKIASETHGVDASKLAYGISMALVTTCMGLIVAIPALFFYNLFQDKVTNMGLEAGAVCEELVRKFKPVKVQGIKVAAPPTVKRQQPPAPQGQGGLAQPKA